jgi:hypothetical protein
LARCGQLRRRQPIVDRHHPRLEVLASAGLNKRPPYHRPGEPAALLRGRGQLQHGQSLGLGQLGTQRGQRAGVELPQRAPQRVDVPLPRPDQVLVGAGQHLDRLGQGAVAGDLAVVVPVGADQVGQHLGVAAVGLGPGAAVAAAVVADHLGVDRIDLVAGGQQRTDQQAAVGLDPDRHLSRLLGMGGDQLVQLSYPGQPIVDPVGGEHAAVWSSRHRSWWHSPQSTPRNNMASSSAPTSCL